MKLINNKPLLLSLMFGFSASLYAQTKSFSGPISSPDTSSIKEIRLDPHAILVQNDVAAIMDSVVYIPLETNKGCLFGEIAQLEITSEHYIIWDETTNAIYFFDKSGTYKYKINSKTDGVKIPFRKIDGFYVDKSRSEIVLIDSHSPYNYYYTLDGKYLTQKKRLPYESYGGFVLGDVLYHFQNYSKAPIESGLPSVNLVAVKNEKVNKLFLPFDTSSVNYLDLFSVDRSFYRSTDQQAFFSQPYDYHVYEVDSASNLFTSYKFVLPALNSLPLNFMRSKEYHGLRHQYTTKYAEIVYAVTDFYKLGNSIVFKLFGHKYDDIVLLNLVSGTAYSINDLIADKTSYMLPPIGKSILGINESGGILSAIPSVTFFQLRDTLSDKALFDKNIPSSLHTFFNGDSNQNPCLVILYPRANL